MGAQVAEDEQMDLIPDAEHPMAKEILAVARAYRAAETDRLAALAIETKQKQSIIKLMQQAKIPPDPDGKTRFKSGKIVITIEPRDMLVKITEKKETKKKGREAGQKNKKTSDR